MPANNGSSGPNTIVVLIIGIAIGAAGGVGVSTMMGEDDPGGARGAWHDSPSPPGSPDRTVRMNLEQIRVLNAASTEAENPMKTQIADKLTARTQRGCMLTTRGCSRSRRPPRPTPIPRARSGAPSTAS
jgi:hypothetical protein